MGGNHWNTPENIITLVRELGEIGLDPCSNSTSIVNAAVSFDGSVPGRDGLRMGWGGYGNVYVNPPYGRGLVGQWAARCAEIGKSDTTVIGLFPASTGTAWFQDSLFASAAAICFYVGRVKFLGAPAPAMFPSVVVYWGQEADEFADVFNQVGKTVTL